MEVHREVKHTYDVPADELVRERGTSPTGVGSTLARAVEEPSSDLRDRLAPKPSAKGPAGVVVLAYLRDHVTRLKLLDPDVRRDRPDAVHAMRVSTRRLRSALASFAPLIETARTDALREDLRWLAGVLGEARDAEVMRDRLTTSAEQDSSRDTGPGADPTPHASVAPALAEELQARYRAAHGQVVEVLDSPRYLRLLDSLDTFVGSPPWTRTAEQRAGTVLPRLVRRDWRRLRNHAAAAARAEDADERDRELHEVRKAAKRLRYACEAVASVFGTQAAALGDAAKRLQEVLGEHQDSVVSRDLLRELAAQGRATGDAAFSLGRLHITEQDRAERAREQYDAAWRAVSDKGHRRWLAS